MKAQKEQKAIGMVLLCLVGFFIMRPAMAAGVSLFDDFSDTINIDRYWRAEESLSLDTTNENLLFSIKAKAHTKVLRGHNLHFVDKNITTLQADISLSEVSLSNLATQHAMLGVAGTFYNADFAAPTSDLGDVFVRLVLGNRGNGLEAWYELQVSTSPTFSTSTLLEGASLGSISLDTVYSASISYDGNNAFTFVFNGGTPVMVNGPARAGAAFRNSRFIDNRLKFGQDNSTPDLDDSLPDVGLPASITGTVDNVTTQAGLLDDFSTASIDQAKWERDQKSIDVDAGVLTMKATGQGSQETKSIWIKKINLETFGATVRLLGTSTQNSTTRIRARLNHTLSNDTFDVANGDTPDGYIGRIWTDFRLERAFGNNRAAIYAERASNTDWTTGEELFFLNLGPINFDQDYDLLIEKIGTVVEYRLDGLLVHSFDLATDYDTILSGNDYRLVGDAESGLQARVQNDAGEVHASFDNIVTDLPPGAADMLIDFGSGAGLGLYARMDNASWLRLSALSPTQVVSGDIDGSGEGDVIAAFDLFGTYVRYDLGPWQRFHKAIPETMSVGDLDNNGQDDVVVDFGSSTGLYARMNDTSWLKLNNASPTQVVTGDMDGNGEDDVIATFGFGTYVKYNLGPWQLLHKSTAEALAVGDLDNNGQDDVVIDFGAGLGLYARMNDASWLKLYNGSPDLITTGDIDGNGADDVVATFGSSIGGSWVKLNLGSWSKLSPTAADDIVTADVDVSGHDDVIASFGSTIGGIYVQRNQGPWERVNNASPEGLAAGHLNSN